MGAIVRGALMEFIATIINAIHKLILIAFIVGVLVLTARLGVLMSGWVMAV